MTQDREQAALAVFRGACELPRDERAAFLETACGADRDLRGVVESMLAWDEDEADGAAAVEGDLGHPVRAVLQVLVHEAEAGQATARSLPGTVGGYRIVRLIARGGMGDVYEAWQENPARRVAIKVARACRTTSELAKRFELEAKLLAGLRHPGIAQIIEAGTTSSAEGAQPFFVMEFVDGQPLTAYADEHLPSTPARLELMRQACAAVAFAHTRGVVHRDLKPDNVLVEPTGTPRVLDFGVAKVEEAGGFGGATGSGNTTVV
jgi:serine/threonine protein kinase